MTRVQSISLSWFRGAAAEIGLGLEGRSYVVYGPNAAGKSSFVDAIEYVLRDGRIQHLAHEYSGRYQERAVLNTHRPEGCDGTIAISFVDGSNITVRIEGNGSHEVTGDGVAHLERWDSTRTVLRQDEVSRFVHSTKGEKYSVLLPLLGLSHLEVAAENLRQLGAAVVKQSGAREAAGALKAAKSQFNTTFGPTPPANVAAALETLCGRYVASEHRHSPDECIQLVEQAIDRRLADASEQSRMEVAVEQLGLVDVRSAVRAVRTSADDLTRAADHLVQAHLDVLKATDEYLQRSGKSEEAVCPACGTAMPREDLLDHVQDEMTRLDSAIVAATEHRRRCQLLRDAVSRVVRHCNSHEIAKWAATLGRAVPETIQHASSFPVPLETMGEEQIRSIEEVIIPAVVVAASVAAFLPPPAAELAKSKEKLMALRNLITAEAAARVSAGGEQLAEAIKERETKVREQIRDQSEEVIQAISADIQRMWSVLHPGEPIADVQLRVPNEADKAIDIALRFYGKELESPRLTLSEGYRNSLGLCVFLAMAARSQERQATIVLDDVIVSLDRAHRGMVAELVRTEFPDRQVIILTHDRDWYSDLRLQLAGGEWQFGALRPYQSPEIGISWASSAGTFADARSYLDTRPDTAANEARKVMDVELAKHAERLSLMLPFLRGDKNDKRGGHEFLEQLIARGRTAFKRRGPDANYMPFIAAIEKCELADRLLVSWGNRGSHSEDVVRSEAGRLIVACEEALATLKCENCAKYVTFAEILADGSLQCQCGALKWKH